MQNRRQFSRVLFSTTAQLDYQNQLHTCKLLDISLHGALITKCDTLDVHSGLEARLHFELPQSDVKIEMTVTICHIEDSHIGLKCNYIDIDSITHLKRLVELNLADNALLQRELSALVYKSE